jgi:hypothetical protein
LAADGLPRSRGAIAGCSMTPAFMAECLLIPDQYSDPGRCIAVLA